jgi:phage regulator Rha-like protein
MSSREIAELTGKQHAHVMRDTRTMLEALGKDASSFGSIYKDSYGREQQEFRLDRELTLTLVSGYNVQMRARIIDRLAERGVIQLPPLGEVKNQF